MTEEITKAAQDKIKFAGPDTEDLGQIRGGTGGGTEGAFIYCRWLRE